MSRPAQLTQHYTRLLTRWPVDRLRPDERSFQHLLRQRIQTPPTAVAAAEKEVNAAYLLLDNAYTKQYPLPSSLMEPASNPTMYVDLKRELVEAPDRTWWGNFKKRITGMRACNYMASTYRSPGSSISPNYQHRLTPIDTDMMNTTTNTATSSSPTPTEHAATSYPHQSLSATTSSKIDVVAIFPLINTTHPDAAVGVPLKHAYEVAALRPIPGITLASRPAINYTNAVYWLNEVCLHTMSSVDLNAYCAFVTHQAGPFNHWAAILRKHLIPAHKAVFEELWLYMRAWRERKFKRLPPVAWTNMNKTSLFEFMGSENVPDHMVPDDVLERRRKGWGSGCIATEGRLVREIEEARVERLAKAERAKAEKAAGLDAGVRALAKETEGVAPESAVAPRQEPPERKVDRQSPVERARLAVEAARVAKLDSRSAATRTEKRPSTRLETIPESDDASTTPTQPPPPCAPPSTTPTMTPPPTPPLPPPPHNSPDPANNTSVPDHDDDAAASTSSSKETAASAEEVSDPQIRAHAGQPLMEEIGERAPLMTTTEAEQAERAFCRVWGGMVAGAGVVRSGEWGGD
ncbi:hypothetical protein LTR53_006105 [Teratosphaeriaceae sp. CCFEE 6253]|nr:hypothetical protein LTR53_006105 [Teratosphaeriaceae sp. CCFEE 6253]